MSAASKKGRRLIGQDLEDIGVCSCGNPGVRQMLYIARLWRCDHCAPKILGFLWVDLNRLS